MLTFLTFIVQGIHDESELLEEVDIVPRTNGRKKSLMTVPLSCLPNMVRHHMTCCYVHPLLIMSRYSSGTSE